MAAVIVLGLWTGQAFADTPLARVNIRYDLIIAGAPAAEIGLTAKLNSQSYKVTGEGRTTGLIDLLVEMRFSGSANGAVESGDLRPAKHAHNYSERDKTRQVKFTYDGNGKPKISAKPPFDPSLSRVPLPESKHAGALDPVSAFVVPAIPRAGALDAKQCDRAFGVLDGQVRVDMRLSYLGEGKAGSLKGSSYGGPTVRCRASVTPIGGHKKGAFLTELSRADDIEVWLAPAADEKYLVPVRISLPTPIGRAELLARQLDEKPLGKRASLSQ